MNKQSTASRRSSRSGEERFLPEVVEARYLKQFILEVTFQDGVRKAIDFSQWLTGPVFEPLYDMKYFRRFFIDGGTVAWPNGADIAPETLYEAPSK
ncbi:MAG: DUF2442 domain-containing protein [Planctomycetales bacterium]|nr:DUF2442 domain-containing protein [Planctomycetales bacterium]